MPEIVASPLVLTLVGVLAYLLGSIPFGIVITRALGLGDLRAIGSGNIGATNVLRTGHKGAALATLLLDAGKGAMAVLIARIAVGEDAAQVAGGMAFLGHLFPVWLGFKGGKGVATALGVLLGISVWLGLATAATWLIIAFFFRYSSLASLVAAAFAPVYYLLVDGVVWYAEGTIAGSIIVMAMLLAWRHKENIQRLIEGKESRLGSKKAKPNAEGAGKSPK